MFSLVPSRISYHGSRITYRTSRVPLCASHNPRSAHCNPRSTPHILNCSKNFRPTASWDHLRLRAKLLSRVRGFFDKRDFLEVETPILSADTVVDQHLDPLRVTLYPDPRTPDVGRQMWLQTSPEFCMKRLMAAGGKAIYQVTRAFRAGERGKLHNPEFTMVEWYRRGDSMHVGMDLLDELCDNLLDTGTAQRISYRDAFHHHTQLDPTGCSVAQMQSIAAEKNITVPSTIMNDRDQWLNLLLSELVEPKLGLQGATILYDYPASQAALARVRNDTIPVAERFELYVRGIELANGYHELIDADQLKFRNRQINAKRVADGKTALPQESRLITAMQSGLPPCCGVALGFDRLVMLAADADNIDDVMTFPIEVA